METLPLSPVDYLFVGPGSQPITFAFAFGYRLDPDRLRSSLESTSAGFPLVRSRLVAVADSDLAFAPGLESPKVEIQDSANDFDNAHGVVPYIAPVLTEVGQPLSRFVVTCTPAGDVLAASISHAAMDGFSYFHFLSAWARTYRGERFVPPSNDRSFLHQVQTTNEGTTGDLLGSSGLFTGERRRSESAGSIERFTINAGEMRTVVQEARQVAGGSLTDNDILVGILWKRMLPNSERSFMTCPVDFRRILPGFPRTYCGCALSFATAVYPSGSEASVATLAVAVRDAVAAIKSERILSSLRSLERYRKDHGRDGMERLHLRHPQRGLIVTNLTRMPVADVDFGGGAPREFIPYVEQSGGAAILPARDGVEIIYAVRPSIP